MSSFAERLVGLFHHEWDKLDIDKVAYFPLSTYVLFCSAMLAVFVLLRRAGSCKLRIRSAMSAPAQIRRELALSVLSLSIFQIEWGATRFIGKGFGVHLTLSKPLPLSLLAISVPLIFIAHDSYFYWTHRLMHSSRLYRKVHREHHRSIAPTAYAAYSFAFFEAWIEGSFLVLYALVLPASTALVVFYLLVEIIYNSTIHSGIDPFPSWMVTHRSFGWVAGSAYHDLHHRTANWNFGLYFRFWDRLMGTEHPDFVPIHDYIHSPQNDGNAYKLLKRHRRTHAPPRLAPEIGAAPENAVG